MAMRDRHGGLWIETCHSDCCSQQGLEGILNTVYRDERDLAKVRDNNSNISVTKISIGNYMICSDIWRKYHK